MEQSMIVLKGGNVSETSESIKFETVLRFAVCSDVHIKKFGDIRFQRLIRMMRTAQRFSSDYGGVDAFLFAGDITDRGTPAQYRAFFSAVRRERKSAKVLAVTAKYHDNKTGKEKKGNDIYRSLGSMPCDFHTVIHGFHFIGISTCDEPGVYYNPAQRQWLDGELSRATRDNPGKPVFVMHHEHIKNTVYGSFEEDGWGNDYFRDIFNKYSSVIHFSGHSHYPLNDPRSIRQGDFTAVGTGSLNYAEFTVDGRRKIHPGGYRSINQAWIVDVDGGGRVLLRGIDFMSRTVLCEYLLCHPFSDCSGGFAESYADYFPAPGAPGKEGTAVFETERDIYVTFPALNTVSGNPCFLYRVFLTGENGKTLYSTYIINEYWRKSRRKYYTAHIPKPDCKFQIAVCAENSFGKRSECLWV